MTRNIGDKGSLPVAQALPSLPKLCPGCNLRRGPEPGPLAAALWLGLPLNLPSLRSRAAAAATMALVNLEPSELAGRGGGRGNFSPPAGDCIMIRVQYYQYPTGDY